MLAVPAEPLTPPPAADAAEPHVHAYRLDWCFDNLEPAVLDALPPATKAETTDNQVFYAASAADQVWPHVQRWLTLVPGSDVIVSIEEIPLSEWIGTFGGDAEDAEAGS